LNTEPGLTLQNALDDLKENLNRNALPGYHPRLKARESVKALMDKMSDGVQTNNSTSLYSERLHNRAIVPVKVLSFQATDRRPGYVGTFSKTSRTIRPRKPFSKDSTIFNYDYDSEEEWEEEDVADGEDVNSEAGNRSDVEEDEADSEAGSDQGGWMCDDDVVEFQEGYNFDMDVAMNGTDGTDATDLERQQRAQKKKEQGLKDANARKKGAAVKLQPYIRGPFLERRIGQVNEVFQDMTVCFLNGTPDFLDLGHNLSSGQMRTAS
jgi:chromatin assembly factor 1 subunit A